MYMVLTYLQNYQLYPGWCGPLRWLVEVSMN